MKRAHPLRQLNARRGTWSGPSKRARSRHTPIGQLPPKVLSALTEAQDRRNGKPFYREELLAHGIPGQSIDASVAAGDVIECPALMNDTGERITVYTTRLWVQRHAEKPVEAFGA